uniref:Uncharacterized protein n=1 Tax=Rhizobium rhizogenes TaxID=359 RepID=A0A7S5DST5_RHIRH|nr:hypothetical protein pC5.8b_387 [Rhizobium rhizogenes]
MVSRFAKPQCGQVSTDSRMIGDVIASSFTSTDKREHRHVSRSQKEKAEIVPVIMATP